MIGVFGLAKIFTTAISVDKLDRLAAIHAAKQLAPIVENIIAPPQPAPSYQPRYPTPRPW